jgi:hypothetical protein
MKMNTMKKTVKNWINISSGKEAIVVKGDY